MIKFATELAMLNRSTMLRVETQSSRRTASVAAILCLSFVSCADHLFRVLFVGCAVHLRRVRFVCCVAHLRGVFLLSIRVHHRASLLTEIACKVTTFSAHMQIYLQISHAHHLFSSRNSTLAYFRSLLMPNSCKPSANTPYFRPLTSKNSPQMPQNGIFSHFLPEKFAYSKN